MISDNRDELPASAYLWHDRSLYIGAIQSPCQLCTHAPALVVCVDHPASVWCEGQWRQTDSFLVGANQQLELITRGGKVAAMFLDPLGREYRQLIPRTGLSGKSIHCDLIDYPLLRDRFLQIQSNKTSAAAVKSFLDEWIGMAPPLTRSERRMLAIMEVIKSHTTDNLSCQQLAEKLHVSDAHLMRLFKKTVGIPLRRYRNWHRLAAAARLWLNSDMNISHAAVSVGFSDTSHFNRYFKQSLGMSPGFLLGFNRPVDIFTGSGPGN